jgi:hypothetical protein
MHHRAVHANMRGLGVLFQILVSLAVAKRAPLA